MAQVVVMPKAGISVESCIIGAWQKSVGDKVAVGEVLFDYETDKATFECESTAEGTLLECFFESGDEVECLIAVCAIGEAGEDVSALRPNAADDTKAEAPTAEAPAVVVEAEVPMQSAAPVPQESTNAQGSSPKARAMAEKLEVNIAHATPTGPRDRVIARDVVQLAEMMKTGTGLGGRIFDDAPVVAPTSVAGAADVAHVDEKFSGIRKAIAATMKRSLTEMAQVTNHHSFDASAVLDFRKTCKAGTHLDTDGITLNDMVLFAVSRTLGAHPDLNAHLLDGHTLRRFSGVHLGVAVDTPRGLMVPTIFNADKLSLKEISQKVKELASMCQAGNISPDLLQGATFTISNLGTLGVEMFTPIVNPPQVAILGVCGTTTKVREGKNGIETYPSMGLSLSYDHCAVDGAPASRFMRDLCNALEQFSLLLAL